MSPQVAALIPLWLIIIALGLYGWWRFEREEIAAAAIKYDDVGVVTLPAPARHHHIIWVMGEADGRTTSPSTSVQGFMTTAGRFVTREKGLKIAKGAKQIVEKHGNPTLLFSEDMW